MKNLVIIGAGQMGRAAAELVDPNRFRILAFGDNDPKKQAAGQGAAVPVLSVEEALQSGPDAALISVLGRDRTDALVRQIREAGFTGAVHCLLDSYELFDVRSRCIGQLARRIRQLQIPGSLAELGVYRGDTAWQLNALLPDRKLYLFDTFEGFDARDVAREQPQAATGEVSPHAKTGRFADTSPEAVLARMPHPQMVEICRGYFPESLGKLGGSESDAPAGEAEHFFALVSLDPDLYAPTLAGLEYFYPRMSPGGAIVVHDYNNLQFEGVKQAVTEFEQAVTKRTGQPLHMVPLADLHGSCVILR
ncbi:MAG: class I SAM-dependent methyltransferase [Firmicutes bacterium]|nr:class I SAM-dependent methyltransferase [Bacillota bacterium]